MENIKTRNWLRAACAMLAALLVPLLVLNFARSEELEDAKSRISAVYQKAFYETCELTEGIAANCRKLLVAGDAAQMQVLLGEISRQAQGAAANLALLPLGEDTVSATIKFINQTEDFVESLSVKIASGGEVNERDLEAMTAISENAQKFLYGMEELAARYERGEVVFSEEDYAATGDESLYPLSGSAGDYPVLLYDGPFSDGAAGGSYALISAAPELSQAEAEQKLRGFIPVDEIYFTGESTPEVPCYEFRLRSGQYWINAGVTKRGGEIFYLLPETQQDEIVLTEARLYQIAEEFLAGHGYGDMAMSYSSRYGGILTINYAATQDGIVLYPDLIKIQLSMKDGSVIGFDAKNYLKNHAVRDLPAPKLTQEEAVGRISARLLPLSARLCVIPLNGAEYFCYEVSAADASGDYLVYIDAESGVERELMQLVSRENGTLVM